MKIELTPCFILHHRDYRENSLLLDIFSRDHGRLALVAKGIKNNKRQKADNYDLYQSYLLSWTARAELGTLTGIELADKVRPLGPRSVMAGFYLNEITMRLLHRHESHAELYDAYAAAIRGLVNNEPEGALLRYYEYALLKLLGYGVILEQDVTTGEAVQPGKDYIYRYGAGPALAPKNGRAKGGPVVSGDTLLQIADQTLADERNITEAKRLFRAILAGYLGNRPLASRQLYQAYIQNKKAD